MKAKTVFNYCWVFDFDETLVKTKAKIKVFKNGVLVKSLTSKELKSFKKQPGEKTDFSEFTDKELIMDSTKYKAWLVLKKISDEDTDDIYILTGRDSEVKAYIYEFLKKNGIKIKFQNIITVGDLRKYNGDIGKEKAIILRELSKKYDKIYFYDDDPRNIELAKTVPNIYTRLVK